MLRVFILQNVPIPASAIAAIARDSASSIGSNSFTRLQMAETDLQIESYDLFLDVDFRNLRFDGKVKIKLESETDVKLNSVELEILEVDANGRPVEYKLEGEKDRFSGVDYIVATVPRQSSGAKYPLGVARDSVKFFESYFGSKYNRPRLHLIAVPEFAAGAMENWGAITFREIVLLVDKDSSIRIKKQVAEVIAHEISHQW